MAVYYVATTGSDNNVGSISAPWLTPQHASSAMKAGDTVYFRGGTYTSSSQLAIAYTGGSSGNPGVFQNYNNEVVYLIINTTAFDGVMLGNGNTAAYLTFSGFNVSTPQSAIGIDIWGPNITVQYCYVTNTVSSGIGAEGVAVGGWASNVTVSNCTVYQTNTSPDNEMISFCGVNGFTIQYCEVSHPVADQRVGIDCKQGCQNGYIHNNKVHDVVDGCIYINPWGLTTSNIYVYDNICYNALNDPGLALEEEIAGNVTVTNVNFYNNIVYNCRMGFECNPYAQENYNFTLINNTFYCNNNNYPGLSGAPGIEIHVSVLHQYLHNCVIRNNIIASEVNGCAAIYIPDYANMTSSSMVVDHNLFWNINGSFDSNWMLGTNKVVGNPLFVNAAAGNFHLQASSPAIGTGSSTGAPTTDFEGNPWTGCIGAYQYQSGGGGFVHGTSHTATVQPKVTPSGQPCQIEVWLGPNASTKSATGGLVSFTSTGNLQSTISTIVLPAVGTYNVYMDVYMGSFKMGSFVASAQMVVT